jgi:hypothetical protein
MEVTNNKAKKSVKKHKYGKKNIVSISSVSHIEGPRHSSGG